MPDDLVSQVRDACKNLKCVQAGILSPEFYFEELMNKNPASNLTEEKLPLLVRADKIPDLPLKPLGIFGNIYAFMLPYSDLPKLVSLQEVKGVEASADGRFVTYD